MREIRVPLIATAAVLTVVGAFVVEGLARRAKEQQLAAHPPFHPPGVDERRQALGPVDGLPLRLRAALSDDGAFEPIPTPRMGDWLASQPESGQTVAGFVASAPNRPDRVRSVLYLQPLGAFGGAAPSLDIVAGLARAFFALPVKVQPPREVEGLGITDRMNRDTGARQLLTQDLRRMLRDRLPPDAFALLGLTMEDLYPGPSWNFVFGEASLTERVAIYSFARYAPPASGSNPADPAKLILLRGSKVLAHETCHMLGLTHCIYYRCVMNGSNHLPELDARPLHLCPVCLRKLQWSIGFDVVDRYTRLLAETRQAGFDEETRWLEARLKVLGEVRAAD